MQNLMKNIDLNLLLLQAQLRKGLEKVIELFYADTPNGWKISIMLEEINFEYKILALNLNNGDQFKPEFKKISPFNKIPVIIDNDNNKSIFESGAILMYLGEKSGKFYPENNKLEINQWLMAQMGLIGPMIGQHHQFHFYNQGKSDWGEERYFKITRKLYEDLEIRLSQSKFLAGDQYSIADIATWPWIARHKRHDIGLNNFKNLSRWYIEIASRPAVLKGLRAMQKSLQEDNARVSSEVGVELARGLIAYRRGNYEATIMILLPIRYALSKIGGSHAQRDLFSMILLDSTLREGRTELARSLASERRERQPTNSWSKHAYDRALALI